jgi:hypothetical protein
MLKQALHGAAHSPQMDFLVCIAISVQQLDEFRLLIGHVNYCWSSPAAIPAFRVSQECDLISLTQCCNIRLTRAKYCLHSESYIYDVFYSNLFA